MTSYVFENFEPRLWTVGFYRPDGTFAPESDHDDPGKAADRVAHLNGSAPTAAPLHVRILSGRELVADLPDWPYPLPQVGHYFFHPPLHGEQDTGGNIAGHVKMVTWRMYDRPAEPIGSFVMTAHPYIEIEI